MKKALILLLLISAVLLPADSGDLESMNLFMDGVAHLTDGRSELAIEYLSKALQLKPESLTIALTLAEAQIESYHYDEATELLSRILKRVPDNIEALMSTARIFIQKKDFSSAILYLERAHSVDSKDPEIAITLSRLLFMQGSSDRAASVLGSVDSAQAYWILSNYYMEINNSPLAEKNLKAYLGFDHKNITIRLKLSEILERQEKYSEAADVILPYIKEMPETHVHLFRCARLYRMAGACSKAVPLFEELLETSLNTADLQMELGRCFVEVGRWREAQDLFIRVQASDPVNILAQLYQIHLTFLSGYLKEALALLQSVEQNGMADEANNFLLNQKADIYTFLGNWEAAEAIYFLLWEEEQNEHRADQIMEFYEKTGCYVKALDFIREDEPLLKRQDLDMYAGKFSLLSGNRAEAEVYLRGLIDRLGVDGYYLVLHLAMSTEQHEIAVKFLEEFEEVSEDKQYIQFTKGAILEATGRREEAEGILLSMLEKYPEDASTLNHLGYMWAEDGRNLDRAHEFLVRALELDPDNGAFLDTMGWILYMQERFEEALDYLLKAFHQYPHDPVILEHLADTYRALNQREDANFYYRHAIQCFSKNQDLISDKLRSLY